MSYRRGCFDYTIGFATALFMVASLLGFVILWKQHVPETVYYTSVPFFVLFSLVGFAIVAVAYTRPIWFYEVVEGRTDSGVRED